MAFQFLKDIALEIGSAVSIAGQAVVSPFTEVFTWILFNILTPLAVIAFVILFFVGQFYLFKFYSFIVTNFYKTIIVLFEKISNTKQFNKLIGIYKNAFD